MAVREDGGMRLRTKVMLAAAAAVLIAGAVLGAFLYGVKRASQEAEPVITSDLLGQQLRTAQELVSVAYHYTNMARYENQLDFYGWKVPFTTKTFIVSYDGVIKAGVDLSKVEGHVDEAGKKITVKLPDSQVLSPGITVNGANTVFTVTDAGRYQLSYNVNTTASLASGTRLLINGTPNTASTVAPVVSLSHFANEILLNLNAGDTISLQMFGIASAATLLPGSAGATLSITRLS